MNKKKVAFVCVHNSCRSQIAEALGITINTIRTQVSRGYKKLRDILSEEVDSSVLFFMFLKNK